MSAFAGGPVVLTAGTIVISGHASVQEKAAAGMLSEEVERRTGLHWTVATGMPAAGVTIFLGMPNELPELPRSLTGSELKHAGDTLERPESFRLQAWTVNGRSRIAVVGEDTRGVLFGTGYLLRQFAMRRGSVTLPGGLESLATTQAPAYPVRGHQLGYRPKNNTFDGWTAAQFEQYIRDLAVFGTNTIELIPPRSDDQATSPLYTLPPLAMMQTISATLDRYGLDCSIWYPAMDKNYSDAATLNHAVAEWSEVFRALPRVDAVFVPGGDPGHTEPKYLLALLERVAVELRRTHPRAQMWVSPQSFDAAWLVQFYELLKAQPKWLTGVVYGPEMRESPEQFRAHVPAQYPIRFYPDITHTLAAQYPVPHWDPAFALTEGREPVDPRPVDQGILFHRYAPLTSGFVAYSEGSNDDINKVLWSAWGWNPKQSSAHILEEYGRYFVSPEAAGDFARGAAGLEENWRGPLAINSSISKTLDLFEKIGRRPDVSASTNWRLQQVLYRANYDAYEQERARKEGEQEQAILAALGKGTKQDPESALHNAKAILSAPAECPTSPLCRRVSLLAGDLFRTIRMQLSVNRFGASAVDRGANLDRIDAPINDLPWLRDRIDEAESQATREQKSQVIEATLKSLAGESNAVVDDLGLEGRHPHLVTGTTFAKDPSGLTGVSFSAVPDAAKMTQPLFAHTFAGTLYDMPLRMRYTELHHGAKYRVRVHYVGGGEAYQVRYRGVRLTQRCLEMPQCSDAEFDIVPESSGRGEVVIEWSLPVGQGGNGRRMRVSRVEVAKTR